MIVAGAKGFAKELLEILYRDLKLIEISFFDNINQGLPQKLYGKYNIIKNIKELEDSKDSKFCIGVGTPKARYILYDIFAKNNKTVETIISDKATIGSFNTIIGKGCTIMDGVVITNDITIGNCSLINLNCTIGHNSVIGKFCDISPDVNISGHCSIGNYCSIGTGSVIIPNVKIGNNCIIGAGTVVTKNIPDNSVVVGVPGKIIKPNIPFDTI
jgi:sugar O-acyltransferase (sialic acid O-acetyltransferase NeuD family)